MKSALRAEALRRRAAIAHERRAEIGEALAALFLAEVSVAPMMSVAGYWPVRDEVDVLPLLGKLGERGCKVALPCVSGRGVPLVFRLWRPEDRLRQGAFGIMEPADAPPVVPDVVLVPVVAFDAGCNRLGYGAGFYDRTLAAIRAEGKVLAAGIGCEAQKFDSVPAEGHDVAMDMIVTEKAVYRRKEG